MCKRETAVRATGEVTKLIRMDFPRGALEPASAALSTEQAAASVGLSPDSVVALLVETQTTDVVMHVTSAAFPLVTPNLQAIAQIEAR